MLPRFPLPAWLDGFDSAVGLMALLGWAGAVALVVVGAVLAARELRRRRRVALADAASAAAGRAADQPVGRAAQQHDR